MAGVYSVPFITAEPAGGGSASYTVPAGNTAIIKTFSVLTTEAAAGTTLATLEINGAPVWALVATGGSGTASELVNCSIAVEAGQVIKVLAGATFTGWFVGGYLLDD